MYNVVKFYNPALLNVRDEIEFKLESLPVLVMTSLWRGILNRLFRLRMEKSCDDKEPLKMLEELQLNCTQLKNDLAESGNEEETLKRYLVNNSLDQEVQN